MSEIELEGGARFAATLRAAQAKLRNLDHKPALDALEQEARAAAPRRTGELAGSFSTRVMGSAGELVNTARHAIFNQFGTRYMDAQPFMPTDPAGTVTPIYLDEVDDIVHTIKGK